jgi:hypothetical protein
MQKPCYPHKQQRAFREMACPGQPQEKLEVISKDAVTLCLQTDYWILTEGRHLCSLSLYSKPFGSWNI